MNEFNDWIVDLEVEDVPCVGRIFTWYKPNGIVESKLDRILVSAKWFSKWQGSTQFIMYRNFLDRYPIMLRSIIVDWGPKLFWVLDCWFEDKSFRKVVCDCWMENSIKGWGVSF